MKLHKGDYFLPTEHGTFRARNLVRIEAVDDEGNEDIGWNNVVAVVDDHSGNDPTKWTTSFSLKFEALEWLTDHAESAWASDPVHGAVKHISSGFHKITLLFADRDIAKQFIERFGQTPETSLKLGM